MRPVFLACPGPYSVLSEASVVNQEESLDHASGFLWLSTLSPGVKREKRNLRTYGWRFVG